MQIKKLVVKGLHGYIDKVIDFYSDLTLLVGINGSGKTSILNLVNWLLKPSIGNLCVTEFQQLRLEFEVNGILHEIICEHEHELFKYNVILEGQEFAPLTVKIPTSPSAIKNDQILKFKLFEHYAGLKPDPNEQSLWDLISKLPKPTVIGLDRNVYAEESDRVYIEEELHNKYVTRGSLQRQSPLDRVKEMVNREYRKRKNSILNLTSVLKNHLMLSTFAGSITLESFTTGIKQKLKISQIEVAEKRVNEYFENFEKNTLKSGDKQTISNYFEQLKQITLQYQNNPDDKTVEFLYGLNASQFKKINKLLKEFEKFEVESNKELAKITNYINTLNFFLRDSAKRLLFKEDTSEISFHTLDKKGEVTTEFKDINFLSSGEQQILILFSYIAFNSQDGRIFIIDEPELSLHIKWQEDFLDQLENVTPKGIQVILATHSPILAHKKRDKTKVLLPYN